MTFGHNFNDAPEIDLKELGKRHNLRFDYEIVDDFMPDFSNVDYNDECTVLLHNLCTKNFERFTFVVTHVDQFPLTCQTIVFGKLKTAGGTYQAEFNIHYNDSSLNYIVVYVKYFNYPPA